MASLVVEKMESLSIESNKNEAFDLLKNEVFQNSDLLFHIHQYIKWDAVFISACQLNCRSFRSWKKKELKELYWKKIEKLVGKEETDKIKQGANFEGTLDLRWKSLDGDACKILAPALAEMTSLETIYLYNNNIGAEGAKYLAKSLKVNTSLKDIELRGNNIGAEGS